MNEKYQKELAELKIKMEKAEEFAEQLPIFKDFILDGKLNYEKEWIRFGDRYRQTPYGWGINRGKFVSGSLREITNYHKKHDTYLFCLYFNPVSLFDSHSLYGIEELTKLDGVFFFDSLNSTFYIEEDYIEQFLEAANEWYLKADKQAKIEKNKQKIEKLKQELSKLEEV